MEWGAVNKYFSMWYRKQRTGKRALAGLEKAKGNVQELGAAVRGKRNQQERSESLGSLLEPVPAG